MRPGPRLAAVLDLLKEVGGDRSVDAVARQWFRKRRYIGSKDRRFISDLVFNLLRHKARLDWRLQQSGAAPGNLRCRLLCYLSVYAERSVSDLQALYAEEPYGPGALSREELSWLENLSREPDQDLEMPAEVYLECPGWLIDRARSDGELAQLKDVLAALREPAPLDLRVNSLKASREAAARCLAEEGIETQPTHHAEWGLRVTGKRRSVEAGNAHRQGWIEVQDESSQLAVERLPLVVGQSVLDFCAGGGGKALAMAARMENQGKLVLHDRSAARLSASLPRLQRAGVEIAQFCDQVGDLEALRPYDLVLVDAPCSGSGRWRRAVEERWRLTEKVLASYCMSQSEILAQAADLVRPGGVLAYATCSFLAVENGRQVDEFLQSHAGFQRCAEDLLLTPSDHGTDGFYLAQLRRHSDEA